MKLFEGLLKTDYQDVLRTLGRYIDQQGFRDVRILETEDGLILQGTVAEARGGIQGPRRLETYLLTVSDVEKMRKDAYFQRGRKL